MTRHRPDHRRILSWFRALLVVLVAALLAPTVTSAASAAEVPNSPATETDGYAQVVRRVQPASEAAVVVPTTPVVEAGPVAASLQALPSTVWEPQDDDGRAPPGTRGPPIG